MGLAFFIGYGPEIAQQGEMITLRLPSGTETVELIMTRGAARELFEAGRRELNQIERGEQLAILLKFPPPELRTAQTSKGRR